MMTAVGYSYYYHTKKSGSGGSSSTVEIVVVEVRAPVYNTLLVDR